MSRKTLSSVFTIISILLVLIIGGTTVFADGTGEPSKNNQTRKVKTLIEEVLSGAELSEIAVMDQNDPLPDITDEPILIVDGDYYTKASASSKKLVATKAKEGTAIIFLGEGLNALCRELGIPHAEKIGALPVEDDITRNDGRYKIPFAEAVGGLKMYPGSFEEENFNSQLSISQPPISNDELRSAKSSQSATEKSNARAIKSAVEWAKNKIASPPTIETRPLSEADLRSLELSGVVFDAAKMDSRSAPYWQLVGGEYEILIPWDDKGDLDVEVRIEKLINDGTSSYDWRTITHEMQIVPGRIAYNSSWRNDITWVYSDADYYHDHYELTDYGPTTTVGQSTANVSVGVTAGTDGAAVTLVQGWSYTASDVQVLDSSQKSIEKFYLKHDIDKTKTVAKYTYYHKPAQVVRLSQGESLDIPIQYNAKFARKAWYGWEYGTVGWQAYRFSGW